MIGSWKIVGKKEGSIERMSACGFEKMRREEFCLK
jgi:hypothetical protein